MPDVAFEEIEGKLLHGEVLACRPLLSGSNRAFLLSLKDGNKGGHKAIYKPRSGERPLRDFPHGTLYARECAAYLVAKASGWNFVPPTVVRGGPYGIGSVQVFVEAEPGASYFTLRDTHRDELRTMALFDLLANNADRKGGHCLGGVDGRVWGIDHGLTFHTYPKLRTVIWDFCGDPIPGELLDDVYALAAQLASQTRLYQELSLLLSGAEIGALEQRLETILKSPVFPDLDPYYNIPWPMI